MNRKNLTAAVLAGLAGAAGIAGTAQAVNLNPDGLGQVLIYPYYTANEGNNTILSVVNTTDNAKAVKVRFLEGFNSREVLDFNLYLSHHDVWVAAITEVEGEVGPVGADYETDTFLIIPDDSCTVPYLYEDTQIELPDGTLAGFQPFLDLAFTGSNNDNGPEDQDRVNEGHFEMIEMGTIPCELGLDEDEDLVCLNEAYNQITHKTQYLYDDDGEKIEGSAFWAPGDCEGLVERWSGGSGGNGDWFDEALVNDDQAWTDTYRNSGGLFGGASIVNPQAGAMYSYDAKAIQGFDTTFDGIHYEPGTINPSLDDGNERTAWVFFGVPQNRAVDLFYSQTVDAVSAVFMHEFTMNEYTTADVPAEAATEWVVTFPTRNFYTDKARLDEGDSEWIPDEDDPGCGGWEPGDFYPTTKPNGDPIDGPGPWPNITGDPPEQTYWGDCPYVESPYWSFTDPRVPFTGYFDEGECEEVTLVTYDRDERTFIPDEIGFEIPPVVSPAPPPCEDCDPEDIIFELCNEVNVLRFGERPIFHTIEDLEGDSLLVTVLDEFTDGWGWIDYHFDIRHVDTAGLVGLPVTGFAAQQFENDFVEGDEGTVKAFYGATYDHKGNVRRVDLPNRD